MDVSGRALSALIRTPCGVLISIEYRQISCNQDTISTSVMSRLVNSYSNQDTISKCGVLISEYL